MAVVAPPHRMGAYLVKLVGLRISVALVVLVVSKCPDGLPVSPVLAPHRTAPHRTSWHTNTQSCGAPDQGQRRHRVRVIGRAS